MNWPNNFFILLFDAASYAVFCALWDTNTVIPVFLDSIGAPFWLIGVISAIKQLGYLFPQPIAAAQLHKVHRLGRFIRLVMFIDRPQLLLFPLLLLFVKDSMIVLIAFIVGFAVLCLGEGIILVPWVDLMSGTLRQNVRGKFWGLIQVTGGLGVLAAGLMIARILDNPKFPYPYNFAVIFGIGAITILPSVKLFGMAAEPVLPAVCDKPGWFFSFRQSLKNKQFMTTIIVQHLACYDALAIPYYIVMVRHRFSWLTQNTGNYILLTIIGGIMGGLFWGFLSDRQSGSTVKLILCLKVLTAAVFLATQLIDEKFLIPILLEIGFILVGMISAAWVGFINYIISIALPAERPFFIALNNIVLLPAAFFPILGGFIRAYWGDLTLYTVTTISMIIAFVFSRQLKSRS